MACCAIGALTIATLAIWWKKLRPALGWRLNARSILAVFAVAGVAMTTLALAVEHLGHHAAYADGQGVLSEMMAQPICRGGSSGDGATAIATYRITQATISKD